MWKTGAPVTANLFWQPKYCVSWIYWLLCCSWRASEYLSGQRHTRNKAFHTTGRCLWSLLTADSLTQWEKTSGREHSSLMRHSSSTWPGSQTASGPKQHCASSKQSPRCAGGYPESRCDHPCTAPSLINDQHSLPMNEHTHTHICVPIQED